MTFLFASQSPAFPFSFDGGAERSIFSLLDNLCEIGQCIEVTVLSPRWQQLDRMLLYQKELSLVENPGTIDLANNKSLSLPRSTILLKKKIC